MFDAERLWRERFAQYLKETSRYLRYIFNGHLVVVMLFLLGTAGYYYQEWLKQLEPDFPAAIIMAVILAIVLTYSPILTLLVEPDKMFYLPLETRMKNYFKRAGIFSLVLQLYLLIILLAVLMPLHVSISEDSYRSFLPFLIVLIVLKGLNLLVRWKVQYFIEKSTQQFDSVVRFFINVVTLYLLFSKANIIFVVIPALLLLLLYLFFRRLAREKGLKWEYLIQLEERRMGTFYRIANLFTDVPKLKDRVHRRKWLDFLLARIPFQQNDTFTHIYTRTFLRSGDYLGLFVRLTVIAAIGMYFLTFGIGQVVLAVLFLYLTGFQLLPLWKHHENKLWFDLYPVEQKHREKAFTKLLSAILSLQTTLFTIVILSKLEWALAGITFIIGLLFTYIFVYLYSKNRRQT